MVSVRLSPSSLNGLLTSRHVAPTPPAPADYYNFDGTPSGAGDGDHLSLLLQTTAPDTRLGINSDNVEIIDTGDCDFPIPNERFTLGLIPAGSTNSIVICTTGLRDPITSALQIVLGKRVSLDIARVKWKTDVA